VGSVRPTSRLSWVESGANAASQQEHLAAVMGNMKGQVWGYHLLILVHMDYDYVVRW
jgi:hypothetical protein